jgi:rhodanese-related sulfurtransferase
MKRITVDKLKELLDRNEVLLIDVRERNEYKEQFIEHAHLIPLAEFSVETIPSQEKPIVIHCKAGPRSIKACEKLIKENPSIDVCFLEGGITAWNKTGYLVKHL